MRTAAMLAQVHGLQGGSQAGVATVHRPAMAARLRASSSGDHRQKTSWGASGALEGAGAPWGTSGLDAGWAPPRTHGGWKRCRRLPQWAPARCRREATAACDAGRHASPLKAPPSPWPLDLLSRPLIADRGPASLASFLLQSEDFSHSGAFCAGGVGPKGSPGTPLCELGHGGVTSLAA